METDTGLRSFGARAAMSRGLAESHTADGQGSPLEGLSATIEVVPLQQGLEASGVRLRASREAAGEAGLAPVAVDDDAHLPAFAFAAGLSGAHDQIRLGVRSSVCSPSLGLSKKAVVMRMFGGPSRASAVQDADLV